MAWSKLVDLELTDEEKIGTFMPIPADRPDYPCGLRIVLTEAELSKLDLDDHDVEIGDMIDLRAFGVVTSISKNEGSDGACCRVEIQLQRIAVENENTESEAESMGEPGEPPLRTPRRKALYAG